MGVKIVITGPESVGKTTLTKELSKIYDGICIEEYARFYVENLGRPYKYEDVEYIANHQIDSYDNHLNENRILFFDTFLEITKVWFEQVYHKIPSWFNREYEKRPVDLYLLCKPDIDWKKDNVRENGHKRDYLFDEYQSILDSLGLRYEIISGSGKQRIKNAIEKIENINIRPIVK
ncbi:ATP-binding protein [Saccharicrinis aurantiacus]|uniref:ATP-binding protein n=1 Tax=Saccharicrinis aurantiacus TaxID=1849719 RepID=UPI0024904464|nr:ATP-binding protein [Saccharicrinis aurantiacus]